MLILIMVKVFMRSTILLIVIMLNSIMLSAIMLSYQLMVVFIYVLCTYLINQIIWYMLLTKTLGIMTFSIAMLSTNDNRDNDAQNNIKKFYDLVIMMILIILRVTMLSIIIPFC
jgi:hypothetical protein